MTLHGVAALIPAGNTSRAEGEWPLDCFVSVGLARQNYSAQALDLHKYGVG